MSVGAADLMSSLATAWDSSGLDASFKALWTDPTDANYAVLSDVEAAPDQPFPYCVAEFSKGDTKERMSGHGMTKWETRDTMLTLNIHATEIDEDLRSAKQIAASLAESVMEQFGGHPTISPQSSLTLVNGGVVLTQYQTDYGVWTDDAMYQWIISYLVRTSVPIAI